MTKPSVTENIQVEIVPVNEQVCSVEGCKLPTFSKVLMKIETKDGDGKVAETKESEMNVCSRHIHKHISLRLTREVVEPCAYAVKSRNIKMEKKKSAKQAKPTKTTSSSPSKAKDKVQKGK